MILTYDPILSLFVVIGAVVYYALKSCGSPKEKEKSIYDIYREIGEKSSEYERYQNWLSNHD